MRLRELAILALLLCGPLAQGGPTSQSDPPPLSIAKIAVTPWLLRFRNTTPTAIGHTNAGGWVVVDYRAKSRMEKAPGLMESIKRDVSELTLERNGKKIVLIKDVDIQHDEFTIHLLHQPDGAILQVGIGEDFKLLDGRKLRVVRVAFPDLSSCTILDPDSGKEFEIRRTPLPATLATNRLDSIQQPLVQEMPSR